jgi:hypothetical protein
MYNQKKYNGQLTGWQIMTYQNEKWNEKEEEKREEKSSDLSEKEEKSGGWQQDSLSRSIWALILIMAGLLLLVVSMDSPFLGGLGWFDVWGAIMIGAALLLGLEIAIRLISPTYARPVRGRIILALILGFLGLSSFTNIDLWPLILIAIGLSILYQALVGRSER